MQRKEPSRAPIKDKRLPKMGIDSAMTNDKVQLKATQALAV